MYIIPYIIVVTEYYFLVGLKEEVLNSIDSSR